VRNILYGVSVGNDDFERLTPRGGPRHRDVVGAYLAGAGSHSRSHVRSHADSSIIVATHWRCDNLHKAAMTHRRGALRRAVAGVGKRRHWIRGVSDPGGSAGE
jgi:hypothetical protein